MVNFCLKCGTKANPGVKFCVSCGNKLVIDNNQEVRDKDGLTASEREIVDSIDYDKIAADVAADHDRIVADAVDFASEKEKDLAKKHRNKAILALVLGIIIFGASFVALDSGAFIFLLLSGLLILGFAGFMFILAYQTKKSFDEWVKSKQK